MYKGGQSKSDLLKHYQSEALEQKDRRKIEVKY
jgi:hypothetical protein